MRKEKKAVFEGVLIFLVRKCENRRTTGGAGEKGSGVRGA